MHKRRWRRSFSGPAKCIIKRRRRRQLGARALSIRDRARASNGSRRCVYGGGCGGALASSKQRKLQCYSGHLFGSAQSALVAEEFSQCVVVALNNDDDDDDSGAVKRRRAIINRKGASFSPQIHTDALTQSN